MFLTIEGIEGSGKSTLAYGLAERLRALGREVIVTREPGGCELGRKIRAMLLEPGAKVGERAELFLFLTDRAQHVREVIRPALARGAVVICDRFSDSTFAYQGAGRGLDLRLLRTLNNAATENLHPDCTLLLDMDAGEALKRALARNARDKGAAGEGRFEAESLSFHERIRRAYQKLAQREPDRIRLLDASLPPDALLEAAMACPALQVMTQGHTFAMKRTLYAMEQDSLLTLPPLAPPAAGTAPADLPGETPAAPKAPPAAATMPPAASPKTAPTAATKTPAAEKSATAAGEATVFTDGACAGNPGRGGWAAIVRFNGEEKELSGGASHTTNNRMEIMAALAALESLPEGCTVMIYTDSSYLRDAVEKKWLAGWRRKGWITAAKTPVKNRDLWERLHEELVRHKVRFVWLRGHNGHAENERCDELARAWSGRRDLPPDEGYAGSL